MKLPEICICFWTDKKQALPYIYSLFFQWLYSLETMVLERKFSFSLFYYFHTISIPVCFYKKGVVQLNIFFSFSKRVFDKLPFSTFIAVLFVQKVIIYKNRTANIIEHDTFLRPFSRVCNLFRHVTKHKLKKPLQFETMISVHSHGIMQL